MNDLYNHNYLLIYSHVYEIYIFLNFLNFCVFYFLLFFFIFIFVLNIIYNQHNIIYLYTYIHIYINILHIHTRILFTIESTSTEIVNFRPNAFNTIMIPIKVITMVQ